MTLQHEFGHVITLTAGRPDMIRFVRLVLLRDESYDTAARDAFHQPFATVDKACAAWIRQQA